LTVKLKNKIPESFILISHCQQESEKSMLTSVHSVDDVLLESVSCVLIFVEPWFLK
jgi:hypothetical protein